MKLSEITQIQGFTVNVKWDNMHVISLCADHLTDTWVIDFYSAGEGGYILSGKLPVSFTKNSIMDIFKRFRDHLKKHTFDEAVGIIKGLDFMSTGGDYGEDWSDLKDFAKMFIKTK